jgi:hypothetical protein
MREERKLRVCEKRKLRIFGHKLDEVNRRVEKTT